MQKRISKYCSAAGSSLAVFALFLRAATSFAATADDSAAAHIARGDSCYRTFDNAAALKHYQEAYNIAPEDFATLVRMARIHNDIGRSMLRRNDSSAIWFGKAVEFAEAMEGIFPQKAETYFWLALTHGSLVPFKGIREKLEIGRSVTAYAQKSIAIDSTFGPSYMLLGIVYREGARLRWYERLIANVIFGGSLPGTLEESEEMLLKSIELDPGNMFARYELSRTYGQMGNREKRLARLNEVLAISPTSFREKDQQRMAQRQLDRLLTGPPR